MVEFVDGSVHVVDGSVGDDDQDVVPLTNENINVIFCYRYWISREYNYLIYYIYYISYI